MSNPERRVHLTAAAWNDLKDILQVSSEHWGENQRLEYRTKIRDVLERLAYSPQIGKVRDDLGTGLRSHPTGSHIIYYRTKESQLVVVRIMHQRRDPGREDWSHLDDE